MSAERLLEAIRQRALIRSLGQVRCAGLYHTFGIEPDGRCFWCGAAV